MDSDNGREDKKSLFDIPISELYSDFYESDIGVTLYRSLIPISEYRIESIDYYRSPAADVVEA